MEALGRQSRVGEHFKGSGPVADIVVNSTMNLITTTCESSTHRRGSSGDKSFIYCWTVEITDVQKKCRKLHRLVGRLHARKEAYATKAKCRSAKKTLCSAINKRKTHGWQNPIDEVNGDP